MLVSRKSIISGKIRLMDLPITQQQIDEWMAGAFIQKVFPHLTASQREFLMTGIVDEEWPDEPEEEPEYDWDALTEMMEQDD